MTIAVVLVQFMIKVYKSTFTLSFPYGQNSLDTETTRFWQPGWLVWGRFLCFWVWVFFFGGGGGGGVGFFCFVFYKASETRILQCVTAIEC